MFQYIADLITYDILKLTKGSQLAGALNFFIYDVPKIYVLLICVIFIISIIRTFLPPEKLKAMLSNNNEYVGNVLAALFGILTPFCSCSAVPLFMGMLQSGVPLGVTMSFLVSSPMINEVAIILLWGLFGWKVALTYILSGLAIAIASGIIIGRLKMERFVDAIVTKNDCACIEEGATPSLKDRFEFAYEYTKDIFKSVWIFILIGVGIGAFIHGYVPIEFVTKYAGNSNPFAVIIAVIIGVPLYSSAAGTIPIVQALMEKGLALGTTLAFMMAVTALSLPEFIILRRVLKPRLLLTFFGTVALGIIAIGYLFNYIF